MWWGIASLVAVVALVGWMLLLNVGPMRCPLCGRINVFRRARGGRYRDECDDQGDLRRWATEVVCSRCRGQYWIVWDDFEGRRASVSPPPGA
jgi:hypothetical protein